MNTPQKTLALLIDGDNAELDYTKQIIQFCEGYGELNIKKAFGDWNKLPLSRRHKKIKDLEVDCVQQDRGKNAADFALAMDVAVMLYKHEADIYFIVSGDGDLTTACKRIGQTGAEVFGIGVKSKTAKTMQKACKKFFDIEKDILKKQSETATKSAPAAKSKPKTAIPEASAKKQPKAAKKSSRTPKTSTTKANAQKQSKPTAKSSAAPKTKSPTIAANAKKQNIAATKSAPAAKPDSSTILKLLILAYQKTPQKDGWARKARFKEALNDLDKQFGNTKLLDLLKNFPQFVVQGDYIRME
ncbi:MAG: NYN domain-containing protein [Chloroflexota bacterium]